MILEYNVIGMGRVDSIQPTHGPVAGFSKHSNLSFDSIKS
jgi:hypothetical protein